MPKLLPPKNKRNTVPRSCGTCKYLVVGITVESLPYCFRDGTQFADDINWTICDLYKSVVSKDFV